jgi:hypothetical protein
VAWSWATAVPAATIAIVVNATIIVNFMLHSSVTAPRVAAKATV